jgi:hypothetical protein
MMAKILFVRRCLVAASCVLVFLGSAQAQSVKIGNTAMLSSADSQNANLLLAQSAKLTQTATIESLSFYVTAASGNLILGIYDAAGPNGGPGALKAWTASFAPTTGWNTAKVKTPVSLTAGTYWLAYLPSDGGLSFVKTNASGNCAYYNYNFSSSLPSKFSTSPASCTPTTWSFYATLATSSTSPTNGACGSSNGATVSAKPTANLCSTGTASAVSGSGPWSWTCAGSNGGSTASCSDKRASSTKVNGACGSSNGATVSAKPTANLCSTGTASAVSGSGPWSWTCAGSNGGSTASCSDKRASGGGARQPVLVQHVSSTSNPWPGNGISGNNFKIPLPNPVLAGDALVLAISYPSGNKPSITDNLGNTWPSSAACTANKVGNMTAAIYVLPNSKAGTLATPGIVTVGLGASVQPFQYTLSEFNNIATSSPVDGCIQAAGISPASGTISPGSFTPTANNNANGGNVIWSYTASAGNTSGYPTGWTAASGFTLLDGDNIGSSGYISTASQWRIQSTQSAVTPSIVEAGDNGDTYNSLAIALKIATAGTSMPTGIHINKVLHFTQQAAGSSLTLEAPATGNLRVLAFSLAGSVSSITDNDTGSSWTIEQSGNNPEAVIAFAPNRGPLSTLKITVRFSSVQYPTSIRFFDIQGANAAPFDVAASNIPTSCPAPVGNTSAAPPITPTTANGLTIAGMPMGAGPVKGVVGPTHAIFDLVYYTGELDFDMMENADAVGHYYNPDLSTENWSWTTAPNSGANCQGTEAVHFKPR